MNLVPVKKGRPEGRLRLPCGGGAILDYIFLNTIIKMFTFMFTCTTHPCYLGHDINDINACVHLSKHMHVIGQFLQAMCLFHAIENVRFAFRSRGGAQIAR